MSTIQTPPRPRGSNVETSTLSEIIRRLARIRELHGDLPILLGVADIATDCAGVAVVADDGTNANPIVILFNGDFGTHLLDADTAKKTRAAIDKARRP